MAGENDSNIRAYQSMADDYAKSFRAYTNCLENSTIAKVVGGLINKYWGMQAAIGSGQCTTERETVSEKGKVLDDYHARIRPSPAGPK